MSERTEYDRMAGDHLPDRVRELRAELAAERQGRMNREGDTRTVEAGSYEHGYADGLAKNAEALEDLRRRYAALLKAARGADSTREALRGYHALMGNLHSLTENPTGSPPWHAWMNGRRRYQKMAQAALADSTRLDGPPTGGDAREEEPHG